MPLSEQSEHNVRGHQMLHVSIAVGILASTAVPLRLLARWKSKAPIAIDDWFVVGSLIPLYGMIAASKSRKTPSLGSDTAAELEQSNTQGWDCLRRPYPPFN